MPAFPALTLMPGAENPFLKDEAVRRRGERFVPAWIRSSEFRRRVSQNPVTCVRQVYPAV
jgi:hypothetical protein